MNDAIMHRGLQLELGYTSRVPNEHSLITLQTQSDYLPWKVDWEMCMPFRNPNPNPNANPNPNPNPNPNLHSNLNPNSDSDSDSDSDSNSYPNPNPNPNPNCNPNPNLKCIANLRVNL